MDIAPKLPGALLPVGPMQESLREWFRLNRRDLSWRRDRTVYTGVVSEFMLQQTQVITVLPYYERWMRELPDFQALADAPEEYVLKLWEGLGYYSRARSLHKIARWIVERGVPSSAREWQMLPGVGPYTAAAIASIVQDEAVAVVDGNVVRVLTRVTANTRTFESPASAVKACTPWANAFLSRTHPGEHNEGLMELGAIVCTRAAPKCHECPLREGCLAAQQGIAEKLPDIRRRATEKVRLRRLLAVNGDMILLALSPPDSRRLQGCHELPLLEEVFPNEAPLLPLLASRTRGISNQKIREDIHLTTALASVPSGKEMNWHRVSDLDELRISGPHRKWITEMLAKIAPRIQ